MGWREPVFARAELLHAAAGPRGDAAGCLYRLADASLAGRDHGRRAVRTARHHRADGAELDLRAVGPGAGGRGAVFRAQARSAGDTSAGVAPARAAGARS